MNTEEAIPDNSKKPAHILNKNILDALGDRPGRLIESEKSEKVPAEAIFKDLMKMANMNVEGNVVSGLFGKHYKSASLMPLKYILIVLVAVAIGLAAGMYIK